MSRKEILSRKIQIFRENQTILKYESTVQGKINFMITRAENLVRLSLAADLYGLSTKNSRINEISYEFKKAA